jgi:hypothetical protein
MKALIYLVFKVHLRGLQQLYPFIKTHSQNCKPSKSPKPTYSKPFQPCAKPKKSDRHPNPYPSIAIAIQSSHSKKTPPYPRTTQRKSNHPAPAHPQSAPPYPYSKHRENKTGYCLGQA